MYRDVGGRGDRQQARFRDAYTKPAAVDHGRRLAMRKKSELVIHTQDGKIGERRSYGNDPFPPRG